jgi:hypothetical protein
MEVPAAPETPFPRSREGQAGRVGAGAGTDDGIARAAPVHAKRIITVMITERTRFPAGAVSMGRVLPAAAPPEEPAAHPARTQRAPLAPDTLTDAPALTAEQEFEAPLRETAVQISRDPGHPGS